jgi:hypothetical protein
MANTHRAIIENFDHSATVIAAGTQDYVRTALQKWITDHPLEEFQSAYVVEFLYAQANTMDELTRLMAERHEHLTYATGEGMTVAEAIEQLQTLEPGARLCLNYDGTEPVTRWAGSSNTDGDVVVAYPDVPVHPEGRIPFADVQW